MIESSADLDDMIFSVGVTFVFGSWIYKANNNGKLQSCLMEILVPQASLDVSMITLDQLAEKFSHLSISDPTRIEEVTINLESFLEIPSNVQYEDLVRFPFVLKNSASIYQDTISYLVQSKQEIPLIGA